MALVLAVMMVFGVATAMATEVDTKKDNGNFTVTINKSSTNDTAIHTYEAYQIFKGDLAGTESAAGVTTGTLSNVEWGNGINTTGIVDKLKAAGLTLEADVEDADAAKIAKALGNVTSDSETAEKIAQVFGNALNADNAIAGSATGVSGLKAGYYLIKDKDGTLNQDGKAGAYTQFMLQVVGNQTVTQKADVPSVDKTVQDNETSDTDDEWDETADHKINEKFQFKLDATIPGSVDLAAFKANSKKYQVIFTDTMSDGVTFDEINSVVVTDGTTPVTLVSADYSVSGVNSGEAGKTWTLTIADLTAAKYASLDTSKSIHVVVTYTGHLNESAIVTNANVDNGNSANEKANENTVKLIYSNNPNATGDETTGTTPEDHVFVFSYKMDNVKKIDSESGEPLSGAGFSLFAKTDTTFANPIKLVQIGDEGAVKKYRLLTSDDVESELTVVTEMTSQSDGTFNIIGLDVGEYVLKETTTPAGYTTAENVNVSIAAQHSENTSTTGADLTLTQSGTSNTVVDRSGATLPSTGGVGTRMFYIGGGLLALVAVVLLVTKRRVGSAD